MTPTELPLPLRPRVKAGLRRTWRDATTLQLGLGRPRAVSIHDADPAVAAFVRRLDGSAALEHLDALATEVGLAPATARELVRRLVSHGALEDAAADDDQRGLGLAARQRRAPDRASWALRTHELDAASDVSRRRAAARVDVHGAGRVGSLAAALLAHAGIGELHVIDAARLRASDVPAAWARTVDPDAASPPSRADVALDVCEQLAPTLRTRRRRGPGTPAADAPRALDVATTGEAGSACERTRVALLAPVDTAGIVDLELRAALTRTATPHLPAFVRETVGVVGPFVLPGSTPCLRCLDLARSERDPAWPRVLAQLLPTTGGTSRTSDHPDASDGVLATSVAAQAVLQVLAHVDGFVPSATATTIETELTDCLTRTRRWVVHPACGCGW